MLREGFLGIWTASFPQYLIRAMLDGQVQATEPRSGLLGSSGIVDQVFIPEVGGIPLFIQVG